MTENLNIIKNFVTDSFGIKIPDELLADLQRNVKLFCDDFNLHERDFIEKIVTNTFTEKELKHFINIITIGETHFFRDQKLFYELQNSIFPNLLKENQTLNALSMGCSTGEEPYSLVIVFDKVSKGNNKKLFVDSIDINKISLAKAKEGVYSEWSFRNTPMWVKSEYFTHSNNSYIINKNIKEAVNFEFFNLNEIENKFVFPNIYYDIIICRNIFIYFDKSIIKKIFNFIYTHLNNGGIFITSPSEAGYIDTNILKKYNQLNSSIFIKNNITHTSTVIKADTTTNNKKNIQTDNFVKNKKPVKELNTSADTNSSYELLLVKGKENYKTHNFTEAFELFTKCSNLNPLEVKPYFYMGLIKQELGEFTEAKRFLQKALFLSPKEIGVLTVYHNLLVNLNDNEHVLISKRLNSISFEDKQNYKDDLFNLV